MTARSSHCRLSLGVNHSRFGIPIELWSLAELQYEWKALAERMGHTTNWWVEYDDDDDDDMLLDAEQCQIVCQNQTRVAIYFKPNSLDSAAIGFVNATDQGASWIPAAIDTVGCTMAYRDRETGVWTPPIEMVNHWAGGLGTILMKSLPLIHFLMRCNLQDRLPNTVHPFDVIEKMGLLGIDKNWWPVLCYEFTKPYFKAICQFIAKERMRKDTVIYPRECDTFAWTRYCRPEDVKVVVVGQDPYPNSDKGIATGLAFDSPDGMRISPSLNTIFQALGLDAEDNNFIFDQPGHGCLIGWAKQGVLLLNAALTVRDGKPGSHMKEWKRFTNAVIHHISCMNSGVVFMLWGRKLWEKEEVVDYHNFVIRSASGKNIFRHLVLKSCHPAHRGCKCRKEGHVEGCVPFRKGFHFSEANAFLEHHHGRGIDWNCLPAKMCISDA